jgi:hypothetical protein
MGGRSDGDGINPGGEQRLDVVVGRAAERSRHEIALLAVRVGDPDQLDPRKIGEDARMVAAHDADTHYADA